MYEAGVERPQLFFNYLKLRCNWSRDKESTIEILLINKRIFSSMIKHRSLCSRFDICNLASSFTHPSDKKGSSPARSYGRRIGIGLTKEVAR